MNDRPSSSDKTDSKDIDDEPIVELSVVAGSENKEDKDGIIELTDVVQETDEVIELTDVAKPGIDTPQTEAHVEPDVETEEPVLYFDEPEPELREPDQTDAAVSTGDIGEADGAEATFDSAVFPDENLETPDGDYSDAAGMNLEAGIMPPTEDSEELDFSLTTNELSEAINRIDTGDVQQPSTKPEPAVGPNAESTVSLEMIESAVENVVRQRFTEKIDQLIEAAIERTVTAEINRLKKRLLGDGD